MSPAEVFTATSFEEKNDLYMREMIVLGEQVLEKSFKSDGKKDKTHEFLQGFVGTGTVLLSYLSGEELNWEKLFLL